MIKSKDTSNNFPGMDYLLRMGSVWNSMLLRRSSGLEQLWTDIKDGNYKHQNALKTWAGAVEDAYELVVDAWRGPGYIPRPAWLYLSYSRKTKSVLERSIRLERAESDATVPDKTDFARLDEGSGSNKGPNFLPSGVMYRVCDVKGNEIHIALNKKHLDDIKDKKGASSNGQYISFVFGQNRGPEPPLVIVVLRVTDIP